MKNKVISLLIKTVSIALVSQVFVGSIVVIAETKVATENCIYEETIESTNEFKEELFSEREELLIDENHDEQESSVEIANESVENTDGINKSEYPVQESNEDETGLPTTVAGVVASGTNGTSEWQVFEDGRLLIGTGTLATTLNGAPMSPWNAHRDTITKIEFEAGVSSNINAVSLFRNLSNVIEIDFTNFDTSSTTNMFHMFSGMSSLQELDISGFDTSNVTNMSYMFSGMSSLQELDVSGFDTSNVTNMRYMFRGMNSLQELDVSGFDTSNVTNMNYMFSGMSSLQELDVSSFDTSNVTDMGFLFGTLSISIQEGLSLTELDVSNFDTSNVTNMVGMFAAMNSITEIDVSGLDTSNVTSMSYMFENLNLRELDVSGFDTSSVTNMSYMFERVNFTKELDVSGFDTSNVTNMSYMFQGMSSLQELDVSGFDTSNVTNMSGMFTLTRSLNSLTLGNNLRFQDTADLQLITQNGFTGRWIGINTGITFESSTDFMTSFEGEADTFIWEEIRNIEVTLPVSMLFHSNQEDNTVIQSLEYEISNRSSHPVHVNVASITEEQNIEEIELLQINGIQLIENGRNSLVEDGSLANIPVGSQQMISYTGRAKTVSGEVNPSFTLLLKFSI